MNYIEKTQQIGNKDYNTITYLEFDDQEKINYWWDEYIKSSKILSKRVINDEFKKILKKVYLEGYGLKIIARSIKNSTYSKLRGLMYYHFPDIIRKGYNISTNKTKELRSNRLKNSKDNPLPSLEYKFSKGIQGRYKHYWLRSSYEYIYIKWLEKNDILFEHEPQKFKLSTGEYYTPDFAIYDNNNQITKYVELKGHIFQNNIHKPKLLEKQLNIPVILIYDITPYCETLYEHSLKEWKKYLEINK